MSFWYFVSGASFNVISSSTTPVHYHNGKTSRFDLMREKKFRKKGQIPTLYSIHKPRQIPPPAFALSQTLALVLYFLIPEPSLVPGPAPLPRPYAYSMSLPQRNNSFLASRSLLRLDRVRPFWILISLALLLLPFQALRFFILVSRGVSFC